MFANNAWFFAALTTAILWGYSYALSEKVLKTDISLPFFMAISGVIYLILAIGLVFVTNTYQTGIQALAKEKGLMLDIVLVSASHVIGMFLIYFAISEKNATLANIVEISYPIFTLFFAWLIFKEVQVNLYTLAGGLLIFSGIGIIFLKS